MCCTKTFVILALAILSAFAAEDCSTKFKQDDNHAKVSDKCVKDLKIQPEDMPKSEEEFTKTYDDKVSCNFF